MQVFLPGLRQDRSHERYRELRSQGREAEWAPYTRLALAILAQALTDATHKPWPTQAKSHGARVLKESKEDGIRFLRAADGEGLRDRLFWLEVAYPGKDPRELDKLIQGRLDRERLPTL